MSYVKRVCFGTFILMMLMFVGCGQKNVDLNKYVTITSQGYNTKGTAIVDFDKASFMDDYEGQLKLKKKNDAVEMALFISGSVEDLLLDECVSFKLDKNTDLNNGDVVKLKWNCNDSLAKELFGVELVHSDISYKVSNLEELGTINPFDYVTVSFSGIDPDGTVTIAADQSRAEMADVRFVATPSNKLKIGDTVIVTATPNGSDNNFADKYGCVLSETERTYIVQGLGKYITDLSEITDDMYAKMDKQLQDDFNAGVATWGPEESTSIELLGNYLVTLKDGMNSFGYPINYLYYVYKVDYANDVVSNYTYYWYGYFTDVLMLEDGTVSVDLSRYTVSKASKLFSVTSGDCLEPDSKHYVAGFAELDSFFNKHIVSKIDKYEYVTNLN